MKAKNVFPLLSALLAFTGFATIEAAEPASKAVKSAAADVVNSPPKDADEAWARLEKLRQPPAAQPSSREEAVTMAKDYFGKIGAAAAAFTKSYPQDPRRYEAEISAIEAGLQFNDLPGVTPDPALNVASANKQLDGILAAADAPDEVKSEAAFTKAMLVFQAADDEKPESVSAFFKVSDEFLKTYAKSKMSDPMRQLRMQAAVQSKTPEGEAILKETAKGDGQLAELAKGELDKREKMNQLQTKPLDLAFTDADGGKIDLATMRGKVVLVDFWASWCGPCMHEMPNVVSTYKAMHPKGFEIVGISLDQDKEKMDAALKKNGMTWPQYFDGGGWQNKISRSFGIDSIPAAWLVDKKGMLRESGLRGPALASAIEKLLAE